MNWIILTVYKTGKVYSSGYVNRLKRGFERHFHLPHKFLCLTDDKEYITSNPTEAIALKNPELEWCWWKMEMFRQDLYSEGTGYIYCDLDTVLMKDVTALASVGGVSDLVMMRDMKYPVLNGSLMKWGSDMSFLYKEFWRDNVGYRRKFKNLPLFMDQGFIEVYARDRGVPSVRVWQDELPAGFFINYQHEISKGKRWEDAHIAWWSWIPKPHELQDHPMIREHWV